MTVNHEIKSHLARLLATEDLVVEHKKVDTACFNVHTRVLTLPMWEKASGTVYDMLVGHEVGHALYTPDEDWIKDRKIPPQFVNVVEDVRIEKLMKRRYAGLAKTFYGGYQELSDQDFFCLENEDVSEMNLADRANLYFKIGCFLSLEFTEKEQEIIDQISSTETFDDVLDAAEVLYNYCNQKHQEETKIDFPSPQNQEDGGSGQGNFDFGENSQGDNGQSDDNDSDNSNSDGESQQQHNNQPVGGQQGAEDSKPEVKTMDSLEDALKQLVNSSGHENVYLELPKLDLKKVVVSNSKIHDGCKKYWSSYLEDDHHDIFNEVDKKYIEFKRSAQKEVNYLVKEFECRKAADSYARATTSRTGVLDCSRLHSYKYNEDLFKKVTTLADGKNHGLVFVLDWSGSMGNVMLDTVKQLFNLVWFCKKVAIPFEVYAFTTDYPLVKYDSEGKANLRELSYTKKDGLIQVGEWFSMMNLLTSQVNAKNLEEQMKNIFRIACAVGNTYYCKYSIPVGMSLSGTPLNESLISLHQILPKFQKENKLQKVQCVILTDGEGTCIKYHREFQRQWETEPYIGVNHIGPQCILRDRKTGNTYSLNVEWHEMTDVLLHNLRNNFPDINFIGIRVMESRDCGHFIRRYCGYYGPNYDKVMSAWKKEKAFSIKTSGYHTYFGLSASALSKDTEFQVSEDASKSQIRSAFVKSLKSKKMNKRILGEFIELVA